MESYYIGNTIHTYIHTYLLAILGLGITEDTDPLVNVLFKLGGVSEAIDSHRSEEMAYTLAHTLVACIDTIPQCERRRVRSPVGCHR